MAELSCKLYWLFKKKKLAYVLPEQTSKFSVVKVNIGTNISCSFKGIRGDSQSSYIIMENTVLTHTNAIFSIFDTILYYNFQYLLLPNTESIQILLVTKPTLCKL